MIKEDWEWEDLKYWQQQAKAHENDIEYFKCELCGNLHTDDTKLKFNDEHNVWCCEDCEDDIEEYLENNQKIVEERK